MSKTSEERQKRKQEAERDRDFAISIKDRDKWKCQICGESERKKINCHHIIPRENRALRHDLMNGISLCILHHKFSLEISPHKNAFLFFVWLEKNKPDQFYYLKEQSEKIKI